MSEQPTLTRGERRCLEFITRCDFTGHGVAVTEDELAFHLGYKRPYVSALVNSLADKGRMSIERRRHPGSPFLHNFYRVTVWNPQVRRGICNLRREFQRLRERSVCKSENRCSDAKRTATALQGSRPGKDPRSFRAGSSTALVARAKRPESNFERTGSMSLVGFKAQNHGQQTAKRGARPDVDDRGTEPAFFDMLNRRFRFTVDVAAQPHNAKLPRYLAPSDLPARAGRCMWAQDGECGRQGCEGCQHGGAGPIGRDGLAHSWAGERVWCNPPYSDLEPWAQKARLEVDAELVVLLLPANRTEQGWWQRQVEPFRRTGVCKVEFLPGRMRFVASGARTLGANERPPFGCCLVIWGDPCLGDVS